MKKILVLGDCQSNGNNCLSDQILGNSLPRTWSLRYHNTFPQVYKWYLAHRPKPSITNPLPLDQTIAEAWAYLRAEERKVSWPSLLKGEITNRSINGATFTGYHKRLLQYLTTVGFPNRVLITDYTFPHIVSSFKRNNIRYLFEKQPYTDDHWNSREYSFDIHQELKSRVLFQMNQPREWHIRKHTKSFNQLVKVLNHYKLKWTIVRFGDTEQQNIDVFNGIMGTDIDCIDLFRQYRIGNLESGIYSAGEYGTKKLNLQQKIAERVQEYIDTVN
jgi:hypothetical protein